MRERLRHHYLYILLPLLVLVGSGLAQEFRGSITGKVTDPAGAALVGAMVNIKNVETNVTATATTNEDGSYNFALLPPGKYTLTVTSQGFKTATREGIEVRVADKLTLDVSLEIGVSAEVTTVASAPALETGSVSTGSMVTGQQISELPLTDGTAYQLATLAPGVSFTGNPGVGGSPTSNGNLAAFRSNGATGPNQVTLDGSPNYAFDGGVGFSPPSEAVQEFRVQTSAFDAQQGYSAGATVNVAVKSGTNDLHGAGWYFNRDRSRTANNFFSNKSGQERPERTYHRFGGVVNGPVYIPKLYNGRDKTFFLFSYERLKNSEAGDAQFFTVPTAAMRQGDFSALLNLPTPIRIFDPLTAQATGTVTRTQVRDPSRVTASNPQGLNVIPLNRLNPVAVAYLNLYPLPNVTGSADGQANYFSNAIRSSNYRGLLTRIDHRISASQSIFGKYYHSFNPENRYDWAGVVNSIPVTRGFEFRTNDGASLDYTATLSPSLVFDLRTNLSRFVQERRPATNFDPATLGFTAQALAAMRGYSYLPRFDIRAYDALRPVRSILGSNRSDYNEGLLRPFYVASFQPTLTQVKGNHAMKYGYDLRVLRENFTSNGYQGGRFFFDGTYTSITTTTTTNSDNPTNADRNRNAYGRDVAAFLFGIPTASTSQSRIDNSTNYSVQSVYHGFFFQDDWRLTPKLTLNWGLRYELELGLTERYDRIIRGLDLQTSSPIEAAAQAAYARNPIPELSAGAFRVIGGYNFADQHHRAAWDADKRNLQPRLSAAYQLNDRTVLRGGFGLFMAPFRIETPIQPGFSGFTSFVPTNNQGRTFVATLNDPFPNGLAASAGSSLGLLTDVGNDVGSSASPIIPGRRRNAKFARLIIGLQRELPGKFVIEANYVRAHGYDLAVSRDLNFIPRQFLPDLSTAPDIATVQSLDTTSNTFLSATFPNPFLGLLPAAGSPLNTATTITRAQLLQQYPQFTTNLFVEEYSGTNDYNSLQLQGSKRFTRDLTLNLTYTWSRLRERVSYLNPSDTQLEDRLSPDDRPHRYTIAAVYLLPLGRGRKLGTDMNRFLDCVVGGWQLNGTYEWQKGQPFLFSNPLFYVGDVTRLKSRAGEGDGQGHKYGIFEGSCATCVNLPAFDTAGLIRLSSNGLRNVPTTLSNLRHMPYQAVNLSITKNFNLGEKRRLQVRVEALNAFNHPYIIDYNLDPNNALFGFSAGTQRNLPRDIQLGAKFTF